MAAENETGFMISGRLYPVPDMGTFTMDEAQVLYDYSGLGLEDFVTPEDETEEEARERRRALRNPGFLRALMHIAYQRGNPDMRATRVKALIGNANVIAAFEHLGEEDEEEDAANPPAEGMTSAPKPSLPNGSDGLSGNSGPDSGSDLAAPAVLPPRIGTTP